MEKLKAADPTGRFLQEFKGRLLIEIRQLQDDFENSEDEVTILQEARNILFKEIDVSDFAAIQAVVKPIVDSASSTDSKQTEKTKDK